MSESIKCAACGRLQPVIAGRVPRYCSGCGGQVQPAARVVPPPLVSTPQPPAALAPRHLSRQFVVLAVASGLLFSLLPMGLAAFFMWRWQQPAAPAAALQVDAGAKQQESAKDSTSKPSPFAVVRDLPTARQIETHVPIPPPAASAPASLTALRPVQPREAEPVEPPLKQPIDLADLIENVEASVVRVNVSGPSGSGLGSGFVADADGTIVTNHHVIEGAGTAEVVFKDGRMARVRGVRADLADKDIAVLAIDPPGGPALKPLRIADLLPRKGEQVVAFGAPLGFSFTASDGLISAIRNGGELNAEFRGLGFPLDYDARVTWLQTTAPISRGNSGGPLVNVRGEVVGLNTLSIPELGQNLNFAVSSIDLRRILASAGEAKPLVPRTRPMQQPRGGRGPGGRGGGARQPIVDGIKTPAGKRLLAGTRQIAVAVILESGDPLRAPREPQPSVNLIGNQCVQALAAGGLQIVEQPGPDTAVLVVRCNYQHRSNTTFNAVFAYALLERDGFESPLTRTWTLERDVTFDTRYATQIKRIATDVKSAVHQLITAIRDARQHPPKAPAPPAPAGIDPPAPEGVRPGRKS